MPDEGIALVEVEPRRTAAIAATTAWDDFPNLWGPLLDEVYVFVRQCPEFAAATEGTAGPHWRNIMLYRDREPNVEVGVLAPCPFAGGGRVIESTLPGGRVATTVHHGDYTRLGETHDAVRRFIRSEGLEPAEIVWEIYGHGGPDPSAVTTELYHLVA
jgi:effector-binding domain-containing protein